MTPAHRLLQRLLSDERRERINGVQLPLAGVNYGNAFLPEDWMNDADHERGQSLFEARVSDSQQNESTPNRRARNFFAGLEPRCAAGFGQWNECGRHSRVERLSLADVRDISVCLEDDIFSLPAKDRMQNWLKSYIQEEDFVRMRRNGVTVIRLPTGYWNWIRDANPNLPIEQRERANNLNLLGAPSHYRPHFDRIFEYASKNRIKILLDLHGLPGSQNGEMHSGLVPGNGEKENMYFNTTHNRNLAVNAAKAMAEYGLAQGKFLYSKNGFDPFWGVQLANEPHVSIDFMFDYYKVAILELRKILAMDVPIVVFAWTKDFDSWSYKARAGCASVFDPTLYGVILWDTHIYNNLKVSRKWSELDEVWNANVYDLQRICKFTRLGNRVFVGEYGIFNIEDDSKPWLVDFLLRLFHAVSLGSFLWAFDAPGDWGMLYNDRPADPEKGDYFPELREARPGAHTVCFQDIFKRSFFGGAFFLESAFREGHFLGCRPNGELFLSRNRQAWEKWHPLYYWRVDLQAWRVSLRSFHGRFLTASVAGTATASADVGGLGLEEFELRPHDHDEPRVSLGTRGLWLSAHDCEEKLRLSPQDSRNEEWILHFE
eukprot:TRINITY_DN26281_c0_g1_i1.p1 TRINITY_DN26281_c0_g1~~TRINITY_DN26281_c0_g1_i1.p1  ORF type:complete len:617 (+),score=74.14 TRINITY_DN26281_c0_g1_i1:50-1852(+)